MSHFLGTHRVRLDRKGRLSVPAPFRAALARLEPAELVLRPSHRAACIEGWPRPMLDAAQAAVGRLDLFSEAADDIAAVLYADALAAAPDAEGRIVLPEDLIQHANLVRDSDAAFLGLGQTFHIWLPEAGRAWLAGARERARAQSLTVPRG
ncbi:MAG: cell division/cell wall cluster transcriptional repressor MraZ [Acetobacteraceae bacterium]|nr:cell division/cell wall cluster transcriptional repressor MraZ [Acetobacteraceae bacterium]